MLHVSLRTALGAFALLTTSLLTDAQTVTGLQGRYRAGQTFLTWNEVSGLGRRYRVYRSETPILTVGDLELEFLQNFDPAQGFEIKHGTAGNTKQDQSAIGRFVESRPDWSRTTSLPASRAC